MKVFVDTNVIIDFLSGRGDFSEFSTKIVKLCEINLLNGYISVLSIPNIVYILRKELDSKKANRFIDYLLKCFEVNKLDANSVKKVINTDYSDFEDALQIESAESSCCQVIISRDKKHYKDCKIEVLSPIEFLSKYSTNYLLRHV